MTEVGVLALSLGLALALYSMAMSLVGAWSGRRDFVASAEHAAHAVWATVLVASFILLHALVSRDLSLEYVASYTSTTLPTAYAVAAFWAGQQGSLLLWLLILSSISTTVLLQNREHNREFMPYVTTVLMATATLFLVLLVFITPPFERLSFTPPEGRDLNPLLQNYWMTIHPPSLYIGFVGFAVPFAFAIAAMATGKLGDQWIRTTRRWTLFAWFFLTLGNLFGAQWAYLVLGWGGYWAWDPVENAAFMPWLTGTAFLHSVMIQERKNMLKVWNMVLIILTFALTIFGTFLTRSGVISSVHSFTESGLGPFFLVFLMVVLIVSLGLLFWRRPVLKSENALDSVVSRESAFLFNNLVLVSMAFAIFWGTVFPLVSETVRGVKITVGPPFFNKVNAPLGLLLLLLTGIGPVIAWRRASWPALKRSFAWPVVCAVAAGVLIAVAGMRQWGFVTGVSGWAIVSIGLIAFVFTTIVMEFYRGMRARQAMVGEGAGQALARLIGKNRRRYGGYIVHLGVLMIFLGITTTSVFRQDRQVTLAQGKEFQMAGYTLRYEGLEERDTPHVVHVMARMGVFKDGRRIDTLKPEKRFYKKQEQPATEVAIRSRMGTDLYLVLGGFDEDTHVVTIQAYLNPLVNFLWWGGLVMALGTGVAVWPARVQARAAAYVAQPELDEVAQ
jgi:cytochrome c-type biogenesis protein CcmF